MGASQIRERLTRAARRSVEADGDRFLTSEPVKRRCFSNGWRNKRKKGEGKKKKEEKRETVDDIGTNTVSC